MADSEGGGGPIDGGLETRAMLIAGGSLPPRKRLLAGLKQNGSWLAASSGGNSSSAATVVMAAAGGGNSLEAAAAAGRGGGGMGAMAAQEADGTSCGGEGQAETLSSTSSKAEGCVSCGVSESASGTRRLKRNGLVVHQQQLCSTCAVSCHKNRSCPLCLVVYSDTNKDSASVWLHCRRCHRGVHMDCEKKRSPSGQLEQPTSAYMCPDCVQAKKLANGSVLGTRAKAGEARVGVNCSVEAGICASSAAAAECSSPCSKKARVHRGFRVIKDGEAHEASIERIFSEVKTGLGRKGVSSQEAAAAAAAAAAATACRAAQAAKAIAAAKASAAVKAAAAAKAALDAAALAARAEAQARAELRRNSGSSEIVSPKRERSEVKLEGEEGGTLPNVNDEELARELHRSINSSPRISRAAPPPRRKAVVTVAGGKPAAEAARSCPRTQQPVSSTSQPSCAAKQLQTRPRSIVGGHKEIKRLDSRVMKRPDELCANVGNQQVALDALKSEPADCSVVSHGQQGFSSTHQNYQCAPLEMMKGEGDRQFEGGPEVYPAGDLNQDMRLSDAEVSQAAAMLDEVLMSEEAEQQAAQGALDEGCLAGYADADGAPALESAVDWQVETSAGVLQDRTEVMSINAETVDSQPGVTVPLESDGVSNLETAGDGAGALEGQGSANVSVGVKQEPRDDQLQPTSHCVVKEGPQPSVMEEIPTKLGSEIQEVEAAVPESAAADQGPAPNEAVGKGMTAGGGKGFVSGGHFSSVPSIPT
ncbi:hypothetical protein R1flu_015617 [Riccia fluitans]|uniref:PHD-type domain-containing protein n=1 Tax=Riccia fluitans TaxID=41844 RepID=A0ABD1YJG3_9MARC